MSTFHRITFPVVGHCHRCRLPIHKNDQAWVVTDDDFLCPYYNARKLTYGSKECLEEQLAFVLEKLKENGKSPLKPTLSEQA